MARTSTIAATVLLAAVAVLAVAVVPAVAHTNHVEADDQHSVDGTLVLEWEFVGSDGWVAVRADDGGQPGEVLGERRVTPETAFRTDTSVTIDDGAWSDWDGSRQVWVVLHAEDGGEGFDPEEDPMQTGLSGDPAGSRITVERADSPTSVTAQGFGAQTSRDGTVTIRRVVLAEAGYVGVHTVDASIASNVADEDVGETVGATQLEAGVHENVTVELDDAYLAGAEIEALLAAVLYTGTEGFDADSTDAVTAGDALVSTVFGVEFRGEVVDGPTPTPTAEEADLVNTPEPSGPTPTPTQTQGDGPGLGGLIAALALAVAALLAICRDR